MQRLVQLHLVVWVWLSVLALLPDEDPPEARALRQQLVHRIAITHGITEPRVLRAMELVPRHRFVDAPMVTA